MSPEMAYLVQNNARIVFGLHVTKAFFTYYIITQSNSLGIDNKSKTIRKTHPTTDRLHALTEIKDVQGQIRHSSI